MMNQRRSEDLQSATVTVLNDARVTNLFDYFGQSFNRQCDFYEVLEGLVGDGEEHIQQQHHSKHSLRLVASAIAYTGNRRH